MGLPVSSRPMRHKRRPCAQIELTMDELSSNRLAGAAAR